MDFLWVLRMNFLHIAFHIVLGSGVLLNCDNIFKDKIAVWIQVWQLFCSGLKWVLLPLLQGWPAQNSTNYTPPRSHRIGKWTKISGLETKIFGFKIAVRG